MKTPGRFPQRSGNGRCGWCVSIKTSTPRSGRLSCQSPSRSAAGQKRCGPGCGKRSVTKAPPRAHHGRAPAAEGHLERENFELRRANEILKKAPAYFAQAELDRRPK